MSLKNAIRKRRLQVNPESPFDVRGLIDDLVDQKVEEKMAELIASIKEDALSEAKKVAATIKKGEPGPMGIGLRGLPGKNGKDGKSIAGKPGKNGKDGNTISAKEIIQKLNASPNSIAVETILGLETLIQERQLTKRQIVKMLNESPNSIEIKTIIGLDTFLKNLQRAIREKVPSSARKHGGGMTLVAGTNITLVRNSNGTWTVASTASGGSNIATEKVVAVQSGTDVTIDLTQLAHTASGVLVVARNGQMLIPNGNASLDGSSWSQSGSTITVYNADRGDVYLVQYTYA